MFPQSPGADAFTLGSFVISWYGVCMGIAVSAGFYVVLFVAKKNNIEEKLQFSMLLLVTVLGFIGARLYHVWNEWWYYQHHLVDIWKVWEGGLALHGGMLLGFLSLVVFTRIQKIDLFRLTDIIAPALILAQALGRWGNYFNEELFGKPYQGFLALPIAPQNRPEAFLSAETFYPLFLYEFLLNVLLFVILLVIGWKFKAGTGSVTAMYLIGYSSIRFSLDFLRFDQFGFWGLTLAQWVSLLLFAIGAYIIFTYRRQLSVQ